MRNWVYIFLIAVLFSSSAIAQNPEPVFEDDKFKDRIYLGGNFGLMFGTFTFVDVSPLVGYRVTNDFSVGLGATYIYWSGSYRTFSGNQVNYKSNIYGGRVFARHNVFKNYFLHAEYESLNFQFYNPLAGAGELQREWVPGLMLGGGLFQPLGRRSGINMMVLYNVLHDNIRSPYNSPFIIRAGITGGF